MNLIAQVTQPHPKSYPISAGDHFGKLTVSGLGTLDKFGLKRWLCKCECGGETSTTAFKLRSGHTRSCGCSHADRVKARRADSVEPPPISGARYIALTKGLFAMVDEREYDRIVKRIWSARWCPHSSSFYAISNAVDENGKRHTVLMHREVLQAPKGVFVDHVETELTLDNRHDNLRLATKEESAQNRARGRNNTSGLKGIWQRKDSGKWCARVIAFGVVYWLGTFDTKEEAYAVYCEAVQRLHGKFARVA